MSESWAEKHRPNDFSEIQGNTKSLKKIQNWLENWSKGDKPQLLHGPPGTGKTTTAIVASKQTGYPLNETNVSSARKSEDIRRISRRIQSSPGGSDHQIVLLDEVDSWHHASTKKPLYEALKEPKNPIFLAANEKYEVPDAIKRASDMHKFKLSKSSRRSRLKKIIDREGLELSEKEIAKLSKRSDLRSAINDLQTYSEGDMWIGDDDRTHSDGEFSAVTSLLKGYDEDWEEALSPHKDTFDSPGSALMWADENVSQEFRGLEAGLAYDTLSRADRHLGRAEQGDYRYWKFASALIEMVPEVRRSKPYDGYIDVSFPSWFRSKQTTPSDESGIAKLFRAIKGERGYGIASSFFGFRERILPILREMSDEEKKQMALDYGLDEDAIEALGIPSNEYRDWEQLEEPEQGDGWKPDTSSASEAGW